MDAHHAIIPTARSSSVHLTENEAKVYTLIARQYLMQFCPDAVFRKCVIELEIAKEICRQSAFSGGSRLADVTGQ